MESVKFFQTHYRWEIFLHVQLNSKFPRFLIHDLLMSLSTEIEQRNTRSPRISSCGFASVT